MFKFEWSVALDQAGYRVRYWRTRLSDIRNNSSSPTALSRITKHASIKDGDDDPTWESNKVLEKLKHSWAELKAIQKQDRQARDAELKK